MNDIIKKRNNDMVKSNDRLKEISDELNENIMAVRGTLELVESAISQAELNDLLLKAIERIDVIQKLSIKILITLKQIFDKMNEIKTTKTVT